MWGNTTCKNMHKMIKLQRRACKIILGKEYVNLETSFEILKLESFNNRVKYNQAVFMYKVANNDLPNYICNMYTKNESEDTNYSLRSLAHLNFKIPMPHSEAFKTGLLYSGSVLWNNLPAELKLSASLETFKTKYLNYIHNPSYTE